MKNLQKRKQMKTALEERLKREIKIEHDILVSVHYIALCLAFYNVCLERMKLYHGTIITQPQASLLFLRRLCTNILEKDSMKEYKEATSVWER